MPSPRHLVAAVLLGLAGASFAHGPVSPHERHGHAHAAERFDVRQDQRDDRRFERSLRRGEASGALTWQEARALERQRHNLEAFERRYRADGRISPHERWHLSQLNSTLDRQLQRALNDRQVAWRR